MTETPRVVVVVTGAAGALGSAVAAEFLGDGTVVVGVDRSEDRLAALDERVRRAPGDLGDTATVDALFDAIAAEHGVPDAVVHTVGTFRGGAFAETSDEAYRLMLEVNLSTAWRVSRAAVRLMRPRGHGAIVHVAARHGVDAVAGAAAYAVSKAGVVHLTEVLAAEAKSYGVRVNAIVPSLIDTAANRASISAETMRHAVTPAAIARVVAFLAGDAAAPVTGAIVPVYGLG